MKQIVKWQADDGKEFASEEFCAAHETLCKEVAAILARLPLVPGNTNFTNGGGYMKHNPATFLGVQRDLAKIGRRFFVDEVPLHDFDSVIEGDKPMGNMRIGHRISYGCPVPLCDAWHRITCVDDDYREWGQPFFALHPEEGEQVEFEGVAPMERERYYRDKQ